MKSKFIKTPDPDLEDDEDSAEVGAGGPSIAAAKKSKIAIIAASSILITTVVYILFFKADAPKEKLVAVEAPRAVGIAASDTGKSPFAPEAPEEKSKDEVELLAKPATPDVPTLPELPEGSVAQDQMLIPPEQQQAGLQPNDPLKSLLPNGTQPQALLPTQQNQQQNQQQNPQQAGQASQNQQPEKKDIDPRYAPIIVFSGTATGTPGRGVGYEKNIVKLKEDPIDQLKKTTSTVTASYITDRSHTIAQGKLLTAVLETAVHTEIPGSVRAVVSRDVYGESGNDVLIPRGSRLFGAYSSKITRGQARVEIGWTRLIRPDGVDLAIGFKASDQFGRTGISGDIDNKYGAIITNSILTSVLAVGIVAGIQGLMGNDNNQSTTTTNPTQGTATVTGNATNQALSGLGQTITDTASQLINNAIDMTPVIRIAQGTRITVIVNSDINIPSMKRR